MLSRDQIREFSKRLAIDENTIIREYIQIVFLSILYSIKESQQIYFKGGTAIRLLFTASRFSEDLDFTAELEVETLNRVVRETVKKIDFIVPGVRLKKNDEGQRSYTGILSYQPEGMKYPLNIHLDFSIREKPETSEQTVLETDFPVIPQPVIRHLGWSEVLAEKIRALLVRSKGRDIYDLWFMLSKGVELDWGMINRKTKMYDLKTSLEHVTQCVEEFDDDQINNDLGKFLPASDRTLVSHLKELALRQLRSRQRFTITKSDNLDYSRMPGGSFSKGEELLYDLRETGIAAIVRRDENTLVVNIDLSKGGKRVGYIRARTRNGVRELNVVVANSTQFIGQSYAELIAHEFVSPVLS